MEKKYSISFERKQGSGWVRGFILFASKSARNTALKVMLQSPIYRRLATGFAWPA